MKSQFKNYLILEWKDKHWVEVGTTAELPAALPAGAYSKHGPRKYRPQFTRA